MQKTQKRKKRKFQREKNLEKNFLEKESRIFLNAKKAKNVKRKKRKKNTKKAKKTLKNRVLEFGLCMRYLFVYLS